MGHSIGIVGLIGVLVLAALVLGATFALRVYRGKPVAESVLASMTDSVVVFVIALWVYLGIE